MCLLKKSGLISSLLALTVACNPYNCYCPPETCSPMEWKETTTDVSPPDVCCWWEVFDDDQLNNLEQMALDNNRDIEIAYFRLKQACAISRVALGELFPQITFDPSIARLSQLLSFNGIPDANTVRLQRQEYSLPFDGVIPFDIWNQLGLNYQSALEEAQATAEAWRWVILSITTELATNYHSMLTLDNELEVLERSREIRQNQVEITQARYDAGIVNYTDVSRAQTELTNVLADMANTMRLRIQFENAIAVLAGQFAPCFELPDTVLALEPPAVPSGLPCAIIQRRADIREAERLVAAAHDQVGVAWADFLPSLGLTGTIGYSSPSYQNLLSWQSRLWSYIYSASQVIFDGGSLIANYQATRATFFGALSEYYRRILIAFSEVEDALTAIEYRARQERELAKSVVSATTTLSLVQMRYEEGIIDYLDVVDAERTLLEAERTEVRARGAQFIATSELIRSIGGGWD